MAFTPSAVTTGPGTLYYAPTSTTEPTSASATLDVAFKQFGYTEEGSSFKFDFSSEDVNVAEELLPIRTDVTGQSATLSFTAVESRKANMMLALNQGATAAVDNTAFIEPPAPGNEERVMIVLDTYQGSRWIFRQCLQTGSMEVPFKKAPNKKAISMEWKLEFPDSGARPFRVYPASGGIL